MQFAVPDMTCGGCANAIARAIAAADPAATVEVDVSTKVVTVTSALPPALLIDAIEAAGFHPSAKL